MTLTHAPNIPRQSGSFHSRVLHPVIPAKQESKVHLENMV